jgi:hypothetical protein
MLTRRARAKGAGRTSGEAVLGSWVRTAAAAIAAVAIFAIVVGLAVTGRLGDLRYTNIPLVHAWPPAGMVFNPFNSGDRSDVISAATQAKVKADLIADGQVELDAVRTGDASRLSQADTGRNLSRTQAIVAANLANGITEDFANDISRYVVGNLADPNDPSITWCVEEFGTSRVTFTRTADGSVQKQEFFRFDDKFWLVKVNGHFLIADVLTSTEPINR